MLLASSVATHSAGSIGGVGLALGVRGAGATIIGGGEAANLAITVGVCVAVAGSAGSVEAKGAGSIGGIGLALGVRGAGAAGSAEAKGAGSIGGVGLTLGVRGAGAAGSVEAKGAGSKGGGGFTLGVRVASARSAEASLAEAIAVHIAGVAVQARRARATTAIDGRLVAILPLVVAGAGHALARDEVAGVGRALGVGGARRGARGHVGGADVVPRTGGCRRGLTARATAIALRRRGQRRARAGRGAGARRP